MRGENRDHNYEIDDTNQRIAELTERKNKYERIIKELELERDKLERQNDGNNKQHESLKNEIRQKNEAIKYAESVLADNKRHIISLEADLNDLKRINDKIRNDIIVTQKAQQSEYNKNVEASNAINKLEDLIRYVELGERKRS